MEDIHSFAQRSSNDDSSNISAPKTSRLIVVDRCNLSAVWSTNATSARGTCSFFNVIRSVSKLITGSSGPDALRPQSSNTFKGHGRNYKPSGATLKDHRSRSRLSITKLHNVDVGPFCANEWRTSKYSLLTFLPKNLYEQFRRVANLYFLITAILQLVIPFSPVGPTTSVLPLVFVVSTTAIKQAYEDYLRHKRDKEVNNRYFRVLKDKKLVRIRSRDINVGDLVFVRNNEEVPCDMILLASGGPADRCYITTANLDGETSLKSRSCFSIRNLIGPIETIDESLIVVECEQPNATLYDFKGYLRATKSKEAYNKLIETLESGEAGRVAGSDGTRIHAMYAAITRHSSGLEMSTEVRCKSTGESSHQRHANEAMTRQGIDSVSLPKDYHEIPLDISNLLLRASRLRNTSHIYGLAVYTGRDTKLAHNSQVKPNKFSSAEGKINMFLLLSFLILSSFSLIGALLYRRPTYWFVEKLVKRDNFLEILTAHYLLYNYLVPISLYVTLEFVKFLSTLKLTEDEKMKCTVWRSLVDANGSRSDLKQKVSTNGKVKRIEGSKCNSSDLNEELGQIQVLFSDKTGTLTENKMRFTACSIYGELYRSIGQQLFYQPAGLCYIPVQRVAQKLSAVGTNRYGLMMVNNNVASQLSARSSQSASRESLPPQQRPFDHRYVPPLKELKLVDNLSDKFEQVAQFFVCLCLCSTICLNETLPLSECLPDKQTEYSFQSASPDEESLISAANQSGLTMCKSNERECFIVLKRSNIPAKHLSPEVRDAQFNILVETKNSTPKYIVRRFERLMTFEFNSVRKRMSVVCRDCDNNCIIMVTKGSESVLDCIDLNASTRAQDEHLVDTTLAHFEAFAKSGLRTMLVGYKMLKKKDYDVIEAEVRAARLSIRDKEHMLSLVYKQVESNLRFLGTTAVEDTLQQGVPKTIADLKSAGIKIWLLTGDKVETATSVAYLCKLLDRDMVLLYLIRQQDGRSCQELLASLRRQIETIDDVQSTPRSQAPKRSPGVRSRDSKTSLGSRTSGGSQSPTLSGEHHRFALVADGRSLYYAMRYSRADLEFICKHSECVLGCRLSPLQKAEIVSMIKQADGHPITAAIGDGANDVSMIQEAHVGIGINGKEGRQAVNSSDFSINRFHMIGRLLFVHGHLFYHRTANVIHYFFYKSVIFVLPQFLYSFYNLSSATSLYHPMMLICFNLIFTSIPTLVYGLYEAHLPERILEHYPKLYSINANNYQLRVASFFIWISLAILQASVAFYFLLFNWGSHTALLESGKMSSKIGSSILLYFVIVITANLKLFLVSRSSSLKFYLCCIGSCAALPIVFYGYSLVDL